MFSCERCEHCVVYGKTDEWYQWYHFYLLWTKVKEDRGVEIKLNTYLLIATVVEWNDFWMILVVDSTKKKGK